MNKVAHAYVADDLKCRVLTANPHQLICMLLDGVLVSIRRARLHMDQGSPLAAGEEVSRATEIITAGLMGSIEGVGREPLADDLYCLYGYCISRLLASRLQSDPVPLSEVESLLGGIAEAWRTIGKTETAIAQPP